MSAAEEMKMFLKNADALKKLIIINVGVYLIISLVKLVFFLSGFNIGIQQAAVHFFGLPASLSNLVKHPWSLITYMFLHIEFMHIFFNMLWLYWIGNIFTEYLGGRKLVMTYFLGGISGGVLYILAYNIFPAFKVVLPGAYNMGASAGVMATVVATATLLPEYEIFFLTRLKLRYIAMFYIVLDVLSISEGNAGGHLAHLGGAVFGYLYIKQLNRGNDLSSGLSNAWDKVSDAFTFKPKMRIVHHASNKKRPLTDDEYAINKKNKQEIMDGILDKISQSGYDSLTREEKDFLFRISKEEK
jgi:membrane associated rhomboid family serine protease